ncbi:hypothetical protein M422DRAFT_264170 [Sphaerobolus stellatus SS14]|uniref:Uncharacterized protein n=1 Tax=Sphaerobolus stellatus (strain SS14) TaxID=990650 RepID=A0A0C9UX60_SPHS4|nr:hypothetical protein M422DRAFT_264170 [Sphaerobolus stellatus SS14]
MSRTVPPTVDNSRGYLTYPTSLIQVQPSSSNIIGENYESLGSSMGGRYPSVHSTLPGNDFYHDEEATPLVDAPQAPGFGPLPNLPPPSYYSESIHSGADRVSIETRLPPYMSRANSFSR